MDTIRYTDYTIADMVDPRQCPACNDIPQNPIEIRRSVVNGDMRTIKDAEFSSAMDKWTPFVTDGTMVVAQQLFYDVTHNEWGVAENLDRELDISMLTVNGIGAYIAICYQLGQIVKNDPVLGATLINFKHDIGLTEVTKKVMFDRDVANYFGMTYMHEVVALAVHPKVLGRVTSRKTVHLPGVNSAVPAPRPGVSALTRDIIYTSEMLGGSPASLISAVLGAVLLTNNVTILPQDYILVEMLMAAANSATVTLYYKNAALNMAAYIFALTTAIPMAVAPIALDAVIARLTYATASHAVAYAVNGLNRDDMERVLPLFTVDSITHRDNKNFFDALANAPNIIRSSSISVPLLASVKTLPVARAYKYPTKAPEDSFEIGFTLPLADTSVDHPAPVFVPNQHLLIEANKIVNMSGRAVIFPEFDDDYNFDVSHSLFPTYTGFTRRTYPIWTIVKKLNVNRDPFEIAMSMVRTMGNMATDLALYDGHKVKMPVSLIRKLIPRRVDEDAADCVLKIVASYDCYALPAFAGIGDSPVDKHMSFFLTTCAAIAFMDDDRSLAYDDRDSALINVSNILATRNAELETTAAFAVFAYVQFVLVHCVNVNAGRSVDSDVDGILEIAPWVAAPTAGMSARMRDALNGKLIPRLMKFDVNRLKSVINKLFKNIFSPLQLHQLAMITWPMLKRYAPYTMQYLMDRPDVHMDQPLALVVITNQWLNERFGVQLEIDERGFPSRNMSLDRWSRLTVEDLSDDDQLENALFTVMSHLRTGPKWTDAYLDAAKTIISYISNRRRQARVATLNPDNIDDLINDIRDDGSITVDARKQIVAILATLKEMWENGDNLPADLKDPTTIDLSRRSGRAGSQHSSSSSGSSSSLGFNRGLGLGGPGDIPGGGTGSNTPPPGGNNGPPPGGNNGSPPGGNNGPPPGGNNGSPPGGNIPPPGGGTGSNNTPPPSPRSKELKDQYFAEFASGVDSGTGDQAKLFESDQQVAQMQEGLMKMKLPYIFSSAFVDVSATADGNPYMRVKAVPIATPTELTTVTIDASKAAFSIASQCFLSETKNIGGTDADVTAALGWSYRMVNVRYNPRWGDQDAYELQIAQLDLSRHTGSRTAIGKIDATINGVYLSMPKIRQFRNFADYAANNSAVYTDGLEGLLGELDMMSFPVINDKNSLFNAICMAVAAVDPTFKMTGADLRMSLYLKLLASAQTDNQAEGMFNLLNMDDFDFSFCTNFATPIKSLLIGEENPMRRRIFDTVAVAAAYLDVSIRMIYKDTDATTGDDSIILGVFQQKVAQGGQGRLNAVAPILICEDLDWKVAVSNKQRNVFDAHLFDEMAFFINSAQTDDELIGSVLNNEAPLTMDRHYTRIPTICSFLRLIGYRKIVKARDGDCGFSAVQHYTGMNKRNLITRYFQNVVPDLIQAGTLEAFANIAPADLKLNRGETKEAALIRLYKVKMSKPGYHLTTDELALIVSNCTSYIELLLINTALSKGVFPHQIPPTSLPVLYYDNHYEPIVPSVLTKNFIVRNGKLATASP